MRAPSLLLNAGFDLMDIPGKLYGVLSEQPYLHTIKAELSDAVSNTAFSRCEKICLIGCMVRKSLSYDQEVLDKFTQTGKRDFIKIFAPIENRLREGKGVCTDQGRVAELLNDYLGIYGQGIGVYYKDSNIGHFLIRVQVDDKKYLYDSTVGDCTFRKTDN